METHEAARGWRCPARQACQARLCRARRREHRAVAGGQVASLSVCAVGGLRAAIPLAARRRRVLAVTLGSVMNAMLRIGQRQRGQTRGIHLEDTADQVRPPATEGARGGVGRRRHSRRRRHRRRATAASHGCLPGAPRSADVRGGAVVPDDVPARLGDVQEDSREQLLEIGEPIGCGGTVVVPTPRSPGVGDPIAGRVERETLQADRGARQGARKALQAVPVVGRHCHDVMHPDSRVPQDSSSPSRLSDSSDRGLICARLTHAILPAKCRNVAVPSRVSIRGLNDGAIPLD